MTDINLEISFGNNNIPPTPPPPLPDTSTLQSRLTYTAVIDYWQNTTPQSGVTGMQLWFNPANNKFSQALIANSVLMWQDYVPDNSNIYKFQEKRYLWNGTGLILISETGTGGGGEVATPQVQFQIRKKRGYIVVLGTHTMDAMTGVKLKVFRQQKGTIGGFFNNAASEVTENIPYQFANINLAKTANFEFDLDYTDLENDINLKRFSIRISKNVKDDSGAFVSESSLLEEEFYKIVKGNTIDGLYIGSGRTGTMSLRKGKYQFGYSTIQRQRYYSLWVALAKDGKAISNYVMIKAFVGGEHLQPESIFVR